MPNPFLTNNRKTPISGPKAYIDGRDGGGGSSTSGKVAGSSPTPAAKPVTGIKADTASKIEKKKEEKTKIAGAPLITAAVSPANKPQAKPSAPAAVVGAVGGAVGGATKKPEPEAPGAGGAVSGGGGGAGDAGYIPGSPGPSAPSGHGPTSFEKKKADIPDFKSMLDRWFDAAKEQSKAAIDYGTEQGVNALQRAEEDAQRQFQAQQRQIAIDEARGLDNQALYAEARGDKGGIGAAQYNSIMSAAAQNRMTVSQQQTKLSTDTARQIADLRAQGEFKKADALLELTQKYLGQLVSLEQWALNYQMDVDQFNFQIAKWEQSYQLELDQFDFQKQRWEADNAASVSSTGGGGSGGSSGGGSGGGYPAAAGMSPEEIKAVQRRLGVTPDGIWGPNTQAAYERQNGGSGGTGTKVVSTGGYNHLLGLMSSGALGGMPLADRVKIIEANYKAGNITRQEAEHLMDIVGA